MNSDFLTQNPTGRLLAARLCNRRPRGSVLVVVLAIVFFLSVIIARFLEETVEVIEYRALFDPVPDQRLLAYSYLEATLAAIQEVAVLEEGRLHAPEQGWGDPLGHSGFPELPMRDQVWIRVEDLSSRFPLVNMDEDLLRALFEEMGLPDPVVRELSDSLLDWIDPDDERRLNGAESEDYLGNPVPFRAANRPLQSFEELRLIQGFETLFFDSETGQPNELFELFTSAVALEDFPSLNLNSASSLVLSTLARLEGWEPRFLWDGLDDTFLARRPEGVSAAIVGIEVTLLRIIIDLPLGGARFGIEAIVRPQLNNALGASDQRLPGRAPTEEVRRTAEAAEQEAIRYPFQILALSENSNRRQPAAPAFRESVIDRPVL